MAYINTGTVDDNPELAPGFQGDAGSDFPEFEKFRTGQMQGPPQRNLATNPIVEMYRPGETVPPEALAMAREAAMADMGTATQTAPRPMYSEPKGVTRRMFDLIQGRKGMGFNDPAEMNMHIELETDKALAERGIDPDSAMGKASKAMTMAETRKYMAENGYFQPFNKNNVINNSRGDMIDASNGRMIYKQPKSAEELADEKEAALLGGSQNVVHPVEDNQYMDFLKNQAKTPGKVGQIFRDKYKEMVEIKKKEADTKVATDKASHEQMVKSFMDDPEVQKTADLIGTNKLPPPSATGRSGEAAARTQATLALVHDRYPKWDIKDFQAKQALLKDYKSTTGLVGSNVVSINTAIRHLDALKEAGENMSNFGGGAWVNYPKNIIKENLFGSSAPTNFRSAALMLAGELAKTFKGGRASATAEETMAYLKNMSENASPKQISDGVKLVTKFISERVGELSDNYKSRADEDLPFNLIDKKSRDILAKMGMDANQFEQDKGIDRTESGSSSTIVTSREEVQALPKGTHYTYKGKTYVR